MRKKSDSVFPLTFQKWRDLFFLHWMCDPEIIQKTLPQGLYVDTFNGKAYLGIIPFKICSFRFLSYFPILPSFLEINVRTYVYNEKKERGIWFYSLEANHYLAVKGGRFFFRLPYQYSNIQLQEEGNRLLYVHERKCIDNSLSNFALSHDDEFFTATEGTLEHFLIERYTLFTESRDKLFSVHVSHAPYQLASAKLLRMENNLFGLTFLESITDEPFHLLYSPGVDVRASPLLPN